MKKWRFSVFLFLFVCTSCVIFMVTAITIDRLKIITIEGILLDHSTWFPPIVVHCQTATGEKLPTLEIDPEPYEFSGLAPEEIRDRLVAKIGRMVKQTYPEQKLKDIHLSTLLRATSGVAANEKDFYLIGVDLSLGIFRHTLPGDKLKLVNYRLWEKDDYCGKLSATNISTISVKERLTIPPQIVIDSQKQKILQDYQCWFDYLGPISRDSELMPKIIRLYRSGIILFLGTTPEEVVYRWDKFEEGAMEKNLHQWLAYLKLCLKLHPQKPRNVQTPPHLDFYKNEEVRTIHSTANYYLYILKDYRQICQYKPYFVGDCTLGDKLDRLAQAKIPAELRLHK